ncbi:tripartite motif-containing protein 2 [Nematostella vectensis]|uniref:tripartite motif-containing protein 2 n=1 Tax=Nematostella vectensis TaxID=45351 RepID=UPI002076E1A8|nr:tripartite motif-containing protein 2 [Nematostella vectensis]
MMHPNKRHVCLSYGDLLRILNNGQRIAPDKLELWESESPTARKSLGLCEEHDCEEMKFYCESCAKGICRDCAVLSHKTHEFVYYKDHKPASPQTRERFNKILTQVEKKKKNLEEKMELLETHFENKRKEIAAEKERVLSRTRQLKALIVEQQNALVSCLEDNQNLMSQSVETKKCVLRSAIDEVTKGLELAKGALKKEDINGHNASEVAHKDIGKTTEDVVMETGSICSPLKLMKDLVIGEVGEIRTKRLDGMDFSSDTGVNMSRAYSDDESIECASDSDINSNSETNFWKSEPESWNQISNVKENQTETNTTPVIPHFVYQTSLGGKGTAHTNFQDPVGIATANDGTIAIADYNNDRIQLFTPDGVLIRVLTHVITEKGRKIALLSPAGVVFDKGGNLVVAERGRHRITVMTSTGSLIHKFGKLGKAFGQFRTPHGVSIDRIGRIIVADTANNRIQVFDQNGEFVFAFGDYGDHKLDYPNYAISKNGLFYVSDTDNDTVKIFNKEGTFLRYLCHNKDLEDPQRPVKDLEDPATEDVQFSAPSGLAVYKDQFILVCDYNRDCVKVFSLDGAFITEFGQPGTCPGQFCGPEAVAALPDGRVVVSDKGNHRLVIFEQVSQ